MEPLTAEEIRAAVQLGLAEDIRDGDATTLAVVPDTAMAFAKMVAREPLVVAGLDLAIAAFQQLSAAVQVERLVAEGQCVGAGAALLRLQGPARPLLTAERVALNFVQRLSGIATLTQRFTHLIAGTKARILDTRKTTPGWRSLEKYAVRCGGGQNHRFGLYDMVLVKDNHLAAVQGEVPDPITAAVQRARERYPRLQVEVEADNLEQVKAAVAAGADCILLDNMVLPQLREAVALAGGRAKTEASGGVNMETVRAIAETGVDFISVGALTHSARAVDIALDFQAA